MRVGIRDGRACDGDATRCGLNGRFGFDQPFFQSQRHRKGLHGRAGFKGVGQGTVTQLFSAQVDTFVRRIAGVIGQRQYFTRLSVQHHHAACLGLVLQDCFSQFLVSKELDLAVNAQLQVFAIHGRHGLTHVLHDTSQTVLDDTA